MANGPTRAQQIGLSLQGFGAGIQGNLPQFQQAQNQRAQFQAQEQERQRVAETERQKTVFLDADAGLKLLNDGNFDGLLALGMNRLQSLQGFPGADPSDTQRLTQLAVAAKNGSEEAEELLRSELETAVSTGKALGILQEPELIKLGKGDRLIDPVTNEEIVGPVTEDPNLGIVQAFPVGEEAITLLTDDKGNFFDTQGNPVEVAPTTRIIEGSSLTGGADELGITNSEAIKLRDAEVSTKTFISSVGDALNILQETPDINTFIGGAAAIVNNLQQEARAIGRSLGVDIDESLLDPSTHSSTFDELGIQNQRMRSLINALAFQAAAASGQTGRSVSDRDVTRFIREIGADAADPRAFARVLRDVADRSARNFLINFETRTGGEFESSLGLDQLPAFGPSGLTEDTTLGDLSDDQLLQRIRGQ